MRSGSGPCGSITTPAFQNQTSLTANKFHKYPTSYYVIIANKAQQYNVCLLMNILLVCMRLFFISWMWKIYFLKMAYIYQTVAYKNTFALQCKMLGLQSFCMQFSWVPSWVPPNNFTFNTVLHGPSAIHLAWRANHIPTLRQLTQETTTGAYSRLGQIKGNQTASSAFPRTLNTKSPTKAMPLVC